MMGLSGTAADIIGLIGTACVVIAYAYNVAVSNPNPMLYNGVNLAGAAFLAVSLTVHFNLASMVLEAIWATIALYGLAKAWRAGKPS